ncbi:unnamed protein product, partial [Prorocentrum cordatum]
AAGSRRACAGLAAARRAAARVEAGGVEEQPRRLLLDTAVGLESVLDRELADLGIEGRRTTYEGGVALEGPEASLWRVALQSRVVQSIRVLTKLPFHCAFDSTLRNHAAGASWKDFLWFGPEASTPRIRVQASASGPQVCDKSRLHHVGLVEERVADGIEQQRQSFMKSKVQRVSDSKVYDTSAADPRQPTVHVEIQRDEAQLSVAATENPHRRAYVYAVAAAAAEEDAASPEGAPTAAALRECPLGEAHAAACVMRTPLLRHLEAARGALGAEGPGLVVWDPFCGRGTLLLEDWTRCSGCSSWRWNKSWCQELWQCSCGNAVEPFRRHPRRQASAAAPASLGRAGSLAQCPWRRQGPTDGEASSTGGVSRTSDLSSVLTQLAASKGQEPQAAAAIELVRKLVAPPPPVVEAKPPDEVFRKAAGLHKEAARKHQGAVDAVIRLEDQLAAAREKENALAVALAEAEHSKRVAAAAVARQAAEVERQQDLSEDIFQLTWGSNSPDRLSEIDEGDAVMSDAVLGGKAVVVGGSAGGAAEKGVASIEQAAKQISAAKLSAARAAKTAAAGGAAAAQSSAEGGSPTAEAGSARASTGLEGGVEEIDSNFVCSGGHRLFFANITEMGPLAWGFVEESVERFNTFCFAETHVQGSHFEKWRVAAKKLDLKILANHARPSRKGLLE